ncbi:MAG: hypothetical protein ACT443_03300, partial [Gemmatimonadota bacterium]
LTRFACAYLVPGMRLVALRANKLDDARARGIRQLGQLTEVFVRDVHRNALGRRAHQDGAILRRLDVFGNNDRSGSPVEAMRGIRAM